MLGATQLVQDHAQEIAAAAVALAVVYALTVLWDSAARAPMQIGNSCVLVTGAAGDIGSVLVRKLVQKNAFVIVWDSDEARLNALVSELDHTGRIVQSAAFDITNSLVLRERFHSACAVVRDLLPSHDRRLVIVNNAGIVGGGPIETVPTATIRKVIEVNVIAPLSLCAMGLESLSKQPGDDAPFCELKLVNVASVMGHVGGASLVPYSASKAGLHNASEALRMEVESLGYWPRASVVSICPYAVQGSLFKGIYDQVTDSDSQPPAYQAGWVSQLASNTPTDNILRKLLFPKLTPDDVAQEIVGSIEAGTRVVVIPNRIFWVIVLARLTATGFVDAFAGWMGGWSGMKGWKGRTPTTTKPATHTRASSRPRKASKRM
jgi:short-subunit dehydrogenase